MHKDTRAVSGSRYSIGHNFNYDAAPSLARSTFNKENAAAGLMPATPLGAATSVLKTPLGSALRSKSPLGSMNRNASVRK